MQVVDMHLVVDRVQADLIRRADNLTAPNAASGHPHAEAVGVVVATGVVPRTALRAVRERRAAEVPAPDHKRLVQQPARL